MDIQQISSTHQFSGASQPKSLTVKSPARTASDEQANKDALLTTPNTLKRSVRADANKSQDPTAEAAQAAFYNQSTTTDSSSSSSSSSSRLNTSGTSGSLTLMSSNEGSSTGYHTHDSTDAGMDLDDEQPIKQSFSLTCDTTCPDAEPKSLEMDTDESPVHSNPTASSSATSSASSSAPAGGAEEEEYLETTFGSLLGPKLNVVCQMARCANHVFICRHKALPAASTFIVKIPKVKASLAPLRELIHKRHLYIMEGCPEPTELIIRCFGVCRASMNEVDAHQALRACMEPDRQDEPCLFMVLERLPGTLLDFWLQFEERRYCVFTATSFLRDLLSICAWLEERGLYLYDLKLENFFVRADGRLILGDLDTVFPVSRNETTGRLSRNHSIARDGIYGSVDCHKMPFQAPEVRAACERLNADKHHAEVVDYTKAHTWSCAAMIYYFLAGHPICPDAGLNRANAGKLPSYLKAAVEDLDFLYTTGDARTDGQGRRLVGMLQHMLCPDAARRPSVEEMIHACDLNSAQFGVDYEAKYAASWSARMETMLDGRSPSGNPMKKV